MIYLNFKIRKNILKIIVISCSPLQRRRKYKQQTVESHYDISFTKHTAEKKKKKSNIK